MKITKEDMSALIEDWRSLVPRRPLTYGEHLQYGREQAYRVRALLDENKPAVNLIALFEQNVIPVHLVPSYVLIERSGLTTDRYEDKLQIYLNDNEPPLRQRFTLLHEWKHALDYYDQTLLYEKLGDGDNGIQDDQIEAIANDFAAHVLMPTELVMRVWFENRDIIRAATIFEVSSGAMHRRLEKLGLIGKPKPRPSERFRSAALSHIADSCPTVCAA